MFLFPLADFSVPLGLTASSPPMLPLPPQVNCNCLILGAFQPGSVLGGAQGSVLPSCSTSALGRSCVLWSWKSGFLSDLASVPAVQRPLLVWIQGGSLLFFQMQRTFFLSSPHVTMRLHLSPQSTGCFLLPQLCSLVVLRRHESRYMALTMTATPPPGLDHQRRHALASSLSVRRSHESRCCTVWKGL